jgi:radical SAM protein with 4Fe4S-binding SPASM domain
MNETLCASKRDLTMIPKEQVQSFITDLQDINLETHNRCNYMLQHRECPVAERLNKFGPAQLELEIIAAVFKELSSLGFHGTIGLHHYCEPLLDTRLFEILRLAAENCPRGKVTIWSNGALLTLELGERLLDSGVRFLRLSAYTEEEFSRLSAILESLKKNYPDREYYIEKQELDDRKKIYTAPVRNLKQPCGDMENLLIITSHGEVQLCCWDYLCTNRFGNIKQKSLLEILQTSSYLPMRQELIAGNREKYGLCSRCWW